MSKFNSIINSFSSGELSKKLDGRTDIAQYPQGADTLQNMFTLRGGGITKRPGSRYVLDLNDAGFLGGKLIPFIFSKTESYIVALSGSVLPGTSWIKVYDADGTAVTVSEDDRLDFSQLTSYDPQKWRVVQSADVLFMFYSDATVPPHLLVRTSPDNFDFVVMSHPLNVSRLPTTIDPVLHRPFLDSNIDSELNLIVTTVAVGATTLQMQNGSAQNEPFFEPGHSFLKTGSVVDQIGAYFKASKSSVTGVTYIIDTFADFDIPDSDINTGTDILTETSHGRETGDKVIARQFSGVDTPTGLTVGTSYFIRDVSANTITLHPTLADARANTNIVDITTLNGDGITLEMEKVAIVSATNTIAHNAGMTSGSTDWEESAWSSKQGFARAATVHEQRLVTGGSIGSPDTIVGTIVGNVFHFMESKLKQDASTDVSGLGYFGALVADDPYQFTIASQEVNEIQWMSSARVLQIGTLGGEYIVDGGPDAIISRSDISINVQTFHGASQTAPARVNNSVYYVSRDGKRLRDFSFNGQARAYQSANVSLLNEDIIKHQFDGLAASTTADTEIAQLTYQESRGILWAVTSIGSLIGLTVDQDSDILAWHRHIIGGSSTTVVSATVIPNTTGTFDDLWLIMKRTINSSTEYYLEKIGGDFEHDLLENSSAIDDDHPWFSDSGIRTKLSELSALTVSSVDLALEQLVFTGAHGLEDGHRIQFTTTGTLPTGISLATDYFVCKVDSTTISLATNLDSSLACVPRMTFVDGDVTVGTDIVDLTSHEYATGDPVTLTTTGSVPTGLSLLTTYYVIRSSTSDIKFATTLANANSGTAVDITVAGGGGTHTIVPLIDLLLNITGAGSGTHTATLFDAVTFSASHLIGETVSVLAGGFNVMTTTVNSLGLITLTEAVGEIIIGLPYTAKVKTMRLEAGGDFGTAQGDVKRIDRAVVRFFRSLDACIGTTDGALEEIEFRSATLDQGDPLPLFSGDKVVNLTHTPDRSAQVIIESADPVPMTIVGVILRGNNYGG